MTASTTTKRRTRSTKAVAPKIDIDLDPADNVVPEPVIESTPAPARKYMSHENCDHARKGDAGKAARAQCRRAHRAWFAAEAEYVASLENDAIAV